MHVDEISDPTERRKRNEEMQEIIGKEKSVFIDCRKLGGNSMDSFFKKLSSACKSIHSTSGRNLSLYCHMMYGLLEKRKENVLTLSDVMSAAKHNVDYVLPDKREEVLDVLHSLDSTGLIKVLKSEDKVWVVVNKGILLSEVDGILFAPKTFKEHVDVAKVHLRSPEPSFYCYNFAPTGPIGKIQAPICSSSNAAAIGVQKSLLQFFYLVAVLEMAYF